MIKFSAMEHRPLIFFAGKLSLKMRAIGFLDRSICETEEVHFCDLSFKSHLKMLKKNAAPFPLSVVKPTLIGKTKIWPGRLRSPAPLFFKIPLQSSHSLVCTNAKISRHGMPV